MVVAIKYGYYSDQHHLLLKELKFPSLFNQGFELVEESRRNNLLEVLVLKYELMMHLLEIDNDHFYLEFKKDQGAKDLFVWRN